MSDSKNQNNISHNILPVNWEGLRVCVLQPDYSTTAVDYKDYDPPRDLSHLIPVANFDHVSLNKLTTYKQLKELLVSIQDNSLLEQEEIVKQHFTNWKGNLEQVDDVCLIGIRV